jgi:hypothetical protein
VEASCTYVASTAWIEQAVFLSSLMVAFVGCTVLANLRGQRLEAEGGIEAQSPEPDASVATA